MTLLKKALKKYREVLDFLFDRDPDVGGKTVFITGKLRSGKTTLMQRLAIRFLEDTDDIIVWRGLRTAQFTRFPDELVCIHIPRKTPTTFKDIKTQELIVPDEHWEISRYTDKYNLLNNLKKNRDKINVVYMQNNKWHQFLDYLPKRDDLNWFSIFFDEVEDIFPSFATQEYWDMIKDLSNSIKYYGQTLINFFMATQQHTGVHWLIKDKIMFWILLPGAKVPRHLRLKQPAIDNLKLGEAYICGSEFQKFKFSSVKNPKRKHIRVDLPELQEE